VSRLHHLSRTYLASRYAILFYSLLLTLGVGPLLAAFDIHRDVIQLFLGLNLIAAVFGVSGRPRWRALQLFLALALFARLVAAVLHVPSLALAPLPPMTAIGLLAAAGALRFAMRGTAVDAEHVYAALSAYLLAGLFCGVLYHTIEDTWPGSFTTGGGPTDFSLLTAVYFSFVTLATLGYGDIVPRTEVARGVVIVEAVAGQLYLAVMVARLVSLYARGRT